MCQPFRGDTLFSVSVSLQAVFFGCIVFLAEAIV